MRRLVTLACALLFTTVAIAAPGGGPLGGPGMGGGMDRNLVTEQLHAALENMKVDESAVLALASQAMDLEKQVKTAHLTLMIRVKNLLTADQQETARALKPQRPMGPRDENRE